MGWWMRGARGGGLGVVVDDRWWKRGGGEVFSLLSEVGPGRH